MRLLPCGLALLAALAAAGGARARSAAGNAPPTDVPWRCRVCEDVVQTWHDQFPCAGGFLNWGDPQSPDIRGCMGPEFKCNSLGGALRDACLSFQKELSVTDVVKARKLWESMMLTGDPYQACIAIEKCPAESNLQDKTSWSPCLQAFRNASTGARPYDPVYSEACDESCYLCLWSAKYWPLFGEVCKPEGASLPQSVPLPGDAMPQQQQQQQPQQRRAMLLEMLARAGLSDDDHGADEVFAGRGDGGEAADGGLVGDGARFAEATQRAKSLAKARARARAYAKAELERAEEAMRTGVAAGAGDEAPQTELQTGFSLPQECFARWKEIERTPRARFFVSWKTYVNVMPNNLDALDGRLWDANVVCKCLGHCDVSRYEDLGLLEACRYGDAEEQAMEYLFREEGKVVHLQRTA